MIYGCDEVGNIISYVGWIDMNPETGTFISMDKYQGTIHDPISLHKYLYANANPVMNSDPTGYFTLSEQMESLAIVGILMTAATFSGIVIISNMRRFLQSSIGDRSKPQPIRELLDTVGDIIIDGISGLRDVAGVFLLTLSTIGALSWVRQYGGDVKGAFERPRGNEGGSKVITNDILDNPRIGSALKVDDIKPIYKTDAV